MARFLELIQASWKQATPGTRGVSILAVLLLVAIVTIVGYWSSRPHYVALASDLAPTAAAEVVSRLESGNIRYRMNFAGSSVLVDKADWNRARLLVDDATDPVESSGWGDGTAMGSPFMDRARMQQQREGALVRTIKTMHGVANASVYLAIPERTVFADQRGETTASVVLELKKGTHFHREQAATIVSLIANSVEGLAPQNVSVVDTRGRLLSSETIGGSDNFSHNFEYRRHVESELAAKANTMLTQLLGEGRAVVRVSADIDFTCVERTETRFDPDVKVPSQQEIHSMERRGDQEFVGGVANFVESGSSDSRDADRIPIKEIEETNNTYYDNSKTVDVTRECPGSINRLTVAVMADLRSYQDDGDNPDGAAGATPSQRRELKKEQVAAIVKQAVGFDEVRGDEIEVLISEFAAIPPVAVPVEPNNWELYNTIIRNCSLGIASLVALALGFITLRKLRPLEISVPAESSTDDSEALSDLTSRIQANPETVKAIISAWMDEPSSTQREAA